jgi:hypothetical protein
MVVVSRRGGMERRGEERYVVGTDFRGIAKVKL